MATAVGATECRLGERCPYHYLFETPPPAGSQILNKVPTAPRPFVLEPPINGKRLYSPGEPLAFGLILIGRALDYLPYFVYVFDELGHRGIGQGKGCFRLAEVSTLDAAGVARPIYQGASRRLSDRSHVVTGEDLAAARPTPNGTITLTFLTPTRLVYDGHTTGPAEFHILFRNLLRRVSFLNYFHCGGELLDDPKSLIEAARAITTVEARLRSHTWERYSARQGQRVPMGGFTGQVTYRGDLTPFWPWLALGECVHVGKGATFGLGQYRIKTVTTTTETAVEEE